MEVWTDPHRWRGSKRPHGNALLDATTVQDIRELKGRMSTQEVADLYNVGKNTVADIWHGRTWGKSR